MNTDYILIAALGVVILMTVGFVWLRWLWRKAWDWADLQSYLDDWRHNTIWPYNQWPYNEAHIRKLKELNIEKQKKLDELNREGEDDEDIVG